MKQGPSAALLLLCLSILLAPAISRAQEEPAAPAAAAAAPVGEPDGALRLARLQDVQSVIRPYFENMLPSPVAQELARHFLVDNESLWAAMEEEMARAYRQAFTREEIERLVTFFDSDLGRLWVQKTPEVVAHFEAVAFQNNVAVREFSILGCSVAVLAGVLEQGGEFRDARGEISVAAFLEGGQPLIAATRTTCTCMMDAATEKWGISQLVAAQANPEFQTFVQELFSSGRCPLPVPPEPPAEPAEPGAEPAGEGGEGSVP